MPENAPAGNNPPNEPNPPEPQPPSEPQPGSEPAARGLKGSGLRYTAEDGVPDWAVGKTADEILQLGQTFHSAAMGNQQLPQQNPPAPPQAPPMQTPQQPSAAGLPNPDLMYSDPAEYQRQWDVYNRSQMQSMAQQLSQPMLQSQAQMARATARSDKSRADVWADYSGEIDAEMARVPLEARANVDSWNLAADLIAGRHRHDLARKEAQTLAAAGGDSGTVRTDGLVPNGQASSNLDAIGKLFAEDSPAIKRFKDMGMSAAKVRDHAKMMGHTPEAYAEMLTKKQSVTYHETSGERTATHVV